LWVSKRIVSQLFFAPRRGILFMNLKYNKEFFDNNIKPYLDKNLSASQIGKIHNTTGYYIWRCLREYATPEQLKIFSKIGKDNSFACLKRVLVYDEQFYKDKIVPLILAGNSNPKIAKLLKMDKCSLERVVKKYGTKEHFNKLRQNGINSLRKVQKNAHNTMYKFRLQKMLQKDKERLKLIRPLLYKGLEEGKISEIVKIPRNTILKIIKRSGSKTLQKILKKNKQNSIKNRIQKSIQTNQTNMLKYYKEKFKIIKPLILKGYSTTQILSDAGTDRITIHKIVKRLDQELYNQLLQKNAEIRNNVSYNNLRKLNKLKVSKGEILLYEITKKYFPNAISSHRVQRHDRWAWIIDVAIPEHKLALEFDGTYWHQDIKKDKRRDKSLLSLGWKTIRFRYPMAPPREELEQRFLTELKDYIK
jgi:very-short-patch-repair endonuclease/SOS response regulatory protein OraA/RecX